MRDALSAGLFSGSQALRGQPLFSWLVKPFGDNPSERFAPSSPFRGAICAESLQETYASPERARGTAKRWRGAPPALTLRIAVVAVSGSVLHWSKQRPPRQRVLICGGVALLYSDLVGWGLGFCEKGTERHRRKAYYNASPIDGSSVIYMIGIHPLEIYSRELP